MCVCAFPSAKATLDRVDANDEIVIAVMLVTQVSHVGLSARVFAHMWETATETERSNSNSNFTGSSTLWPVIKAFWTYGSWNSDC